MTSCRLTILRRERTWILSRGKLHQMPDGVMMFAPTKFVPFATTGLFSWPGKIRMGMDLLIHGEGWAGEFNDETLESSWSVAWAGVPRPSCRTARGRCSCLRSDADVPCCDLPRLLEMEQNYGSLLKAFLAIRHKVEEMRRKYPPKRGEKPRTFLRPL